MRDTDCCIVLCSSGRFGGGGRVRGRANYCLPWATILTSPPPMLGAAAELAEKLNALACGVEAVTDPVKLNVGFGGASLLTPKLKGAPLCATEKDKQKAQYTVFEDRVSLLVSWGRDGVRGIADGIVTSSLLSACKLWQTAFINGGFVAFTLRLMLNWGAGQQT